MIRTISELILGAGCTLAAWHLAQGWPPGQGGTIAATLASLAGTMLGFVVATLAILATITSAAIVQKMLATGHYHDLLKDLFRSAAWFGASSLGGLAGVFCLGDLASQLTALSLGAFVVATLRLLRGGSHFYIVLEHLK